MKTHLSKILSACNTLLHAHMFAHHYHDHNLTQHTVLDFNSPIHLYRCLTHPLLCTHNAVLEHEHLLSASLSLPCVLSPSPSLPLSLSPSLPVCVLGVIALQCYPVHPLCYMYIPWHLHCGALPTAPSCTPPLFF